MIYQVICTLLRWFMRFFYPRVFILHSESIPEDKPFILVCNHQNSFMDAFLLAIQFETPLYFIKPVGRQTRGLLRLLMESLHIVPLPKGWHRSDEEQLSNPWTNLRNLIANNKPLVFFSESNVDQLKVSKGAAKIAFHTEEVFDFGLDIEIIPITTHYSNRGEAIIMLGQGIPVRSFEKDYKRYPARTIKYTTKYLEEELINGCAAEHAEFARLLGQFWKISLRKSPSGAIKDLSVALSNPISKALDKENPTLLKNRLYFFFKQLRKIKLDDWSPAKPGVFSFLLCFIGAPVFVLGYTINWLRYQLSGFFSLVFLPRLKHNESSRMIIGLLLFPLIWLLISSQLILLYHSAWLGLLALIILPLLAQFTYYYSQKCANVISYIKYLYCLRFHSAEVRTIEQTYAEVLYLLRKSTPAEVFSA